MGKNTKTIFIPIQVPKGNICNAQGNTCKFIGAYWNWCHAFDEPLEYDPLYFYGNKVYPVEKCWQCKDS
jgi:hypothetical protein